MKTIVKSIAIFSFIIVLFACSNQKKIIYKNVDEQAKCESKNGYWYNNKCWKDFEDEGIPKSKIDSIVVAQMKIIDKSTIEIDNQTYPLTAFMPMEEKEGMLFISVYGTYGDYNTLLFPTGKKNVKNGEFQSPVVFVKGDAMSGELDESSVLRGTATVKVIDLDILKMELSGEVSDSLSTISKKFTFSTNEAITGAGNSHIEVKGNEAYLSGDLGTMTYSQIKDLIKNHPKVKTIVMTKISGSVNDAVNMHTGRLIHENGFTTKVLSDSDIASGGVDLFCAGVNRIVEKGAKIGVHSWCCVNDLTAIEIPKDHPAHQYQLEYFTMALGEENGPAFYFYTLEASPFDDVHYMSNEEIKKWKISTEFIENE